MADACRSAGLAQPELEEVATRFRVTSHTKQTGSHVVDPIDEAILRAPASGKGLSTREIAATIDRTPRAARTRLASLVDRGLVREVGARPARPEAAVLADRKRFDDPSSEQRSRPSPVLACLDEHPDDRGRRGQPRTRHPEEGAAARLQEVRDRLLHRERRERRRRLRRHQGRLRRDPGRWASTA